MNETPEPEQPDYIRDSIETLREKAAHPEGAVPEPQGPTTEAGREFIERYAHASPGDAYRRAALAIEAEARAATPLDIDALRAALREQWEWNHSEHCRNEWPHTGHCYWPLPVELGGDPDAYRTYASPDARLLTLTREHDSSVEGILSHDIALAMAEHLSKGIPDSLEVQVQEYENDETLDLDVGPAPIVLSPGGIESKEGVNG